MRPRCRDISLSKYVRFNPWAESPGGKPPGHKSATKSRGVNPRAARMQESPWGGKTPGSHKHTKIPRAGGSPPGISRRFGQSILPPDILEAEFFQRQSKIWPPARPAPWPVLPRGHQASANGVFKEVFGNLAQVIGLTHHLIMKALLPHVPISQPTPELGG